MRSSTTATACRDVRSGRVRLYTMNAADWTERCPPNVEDAARLKRDAVLDCEVVCLLRLVGEDLRRQPQLLKLLGRKRDGIQYVAHAEMPGDEAFQAACELGWRGSSQSG
jgi:ATP-dependent DNA ligase